MMVVCKKWFKNDNDDHDDDNNKRNKNIITAQGTTKRIMMPNLEESAERKKQNRVLLVQWRFISLLLLLAVGISTLVVEHYYRNRDDDDLRLETATTKRQRTIISTRQLEEQHLLSSSEQTKAFQEQEQHQAKTSKEKVKWLTSQWRKERTQKTIRDGKTTIDATDTFFGSSQVVHVVQIGTKQYQEKYHTSTLLNKQWSKCAGYQYHLLTMEDDDDNNNDDPSQNRDSTNDCVYTKKVSMIKDFLFSLSEGEWMIFVDMDAYYQSPNCHELDDILQLEHEQTFKQFDKTPPQRCDMMFHMCSIGINSGLLIVKKTSKTMEYIQSWSTHQTLHGFCKGPADQWTLQEVLLRDYHMFDIQECLELEKGPTTFSHRGQCSNDMLQQIKHSSEQHYYHNFPNKGRYGEYIEQHLNEYTLTPMLGKNGNNNVCVFDCLSKHPLQCKDCEYDFLAKKRHPADGTRTCRIQNPLFHHSHHFLHDDGVNIQKLG